MKFILFLVFGLIIFLSVLLGGKKYRSTALYALAIGGIVNANFFHAGAYPINCFGLPFGIDSVIYTLFVFCVIVMFLKENKRSAYLLAISSVIAILFSALMQLISDLLSLGSSFAVWNAFVSFVISAFASVVAIVIMLEILNKCKNKINDLLIIVIGVIVATIINSGIYYPLSMLVSGVPSNIWKTLLASLIGKFISLLMSLLTYVFIQKMDKLKISLEPERTGIRSVDLWNFFLKKSDDDLYNFEKLSDDEKTALILNLLYTNCASGDGWEYFFNYVNEYQNFDSVIEKVIKTCINKELKENYLKALQIYKKYQENYDYEEINKELFKQEKNIENACKKFEDEHEDWYLK